MSTDLDEEHLDSIVQDNNEMGEITLDADLEAPIDMDKPRPGATFALVVLFSTY